MPVLLIIYQNIIFVNYNTYPFEMLYKRPGLHQLGCLFVVLKKLLSWMQNDPNQLSTYSRKPKSLELKNILVHFFLQQLSQE